MSEICKEVECESNSLFINEFDESIRNEKRQREESIHNSSGASIDEEGFTTVTRRRSKRPAIRKSSSNDDNDDFEMEKEPEETEKIEVSVTSKVILPKQMTLAKLLRAENIQKILNVKYKSPYKILIEFDDQENAHKLLTNKKFAELDYRCQLTQGLQTIFGVVRNIDLDIQEEEMKESFESELEILSIKRLKRYLDNGEWIDSESVRVCFKSSALPPYILVYGCRFKVERFTFPVTQCSSCWRYGHSKKFCPLKKSYCPKCGKLHTNCDTKLFYCINCKGDHMALDRTSCPIYHKEKEIREIMSEENCKYRKALAIYNNKRKFHQGKNNKKEANQEVNSQHINYNESLNKTYRDVLITEAQIHNENIRELSNSEQEDELMQTPVTGLQKLKRKKKKVNKGTGAVNDIDCTIEDKERERCQKENKDEEKGRKRFNFTLMLLKIKEICFSPLSFEDKINKVFKVFIEEIKTLVIGLFQNNDILKNLFCLFYNG